MTASFPTSIKSFTTKVDDLDYPLAEHINSPQDEIVALETLLGVNGGSWIGEGQVMNGKISVSVATSDLTVSLVTIAGTAASSTNPIYVRINNTVRKITGALSVTKNDGTNWCNVGGAELATKETDFFVYLGYNATDGVVIGFSRIPYGTLYSSFSATSTNDKYCAISTITNAAAGDNYVNIGRFAATLSAGAGYTWTVPTFTNTNLIQRPIFNTRILDWQPVYTNLTEGGGAKTYKYQIVGNTIKLDLGLTFDGTSAVSGSPSFTVPMLKASYYGGYLSGPVGCVVRAYDQSAGVIYPCTGVLVTGFSFSAIAAGGTYASQVAISSTIPFTWATSDAINIGIEYYI